VEAAEWAGSVLRTTTAKNDLGRSVLGSGGSSHVSGDYTIVVPAAQIDELKPEGKDMCLPRQRQATAPYPGAGWMGRVLLAEAGERPAHPGGV